MKTYLECVNEAAGIVKCKMINKEAFDELIKYLSPILNKAAELYASQSNSHKHGVMQAEGSDGAKGAAVGQRSVGTK